MASAETNHRRTWRRMLPPAVLLVLMGAVAVKLFDYSPVERIVPLWVAGISLLLIVLELLVQSGSRAGRAVDKAFSGGAETVVDPAEAEPQERRRQFAAVAWVVGALVLIYLVGLLPGSALYMAASLYFGGGKSLPKALGTAVVVTAIVWVVFEWGMSYELYRGVLFGGFAGL